MNDEEIAAGLAPTPGYRYAERIDDELFIAGQVPLDAGGQVVAPGDPTAQARRCLENLRILLGVHGFDLADVRQVTVYVVGERDALESAWTGVTQWWDGPVPPATLVGVRSLGHEHQSVEVDARVRRRR